MKAIPTLLLIFVFTNSQSQGIRNFLKEDLFSWEDVEVILDEKGRSELYYLLGDNTKNINSMHPVSFNKDTLVDAIYYEPGFIEFFINDGEKLVSLGKDEGLLIGLQQNKLFEITTVHFMNKTGNHGYYQQWLVVSNDGKMKIIKLEKVYFLPETTMPDYLNINLEVRLKENAFLKSEPGLPDNAKSFSEYQAGEAGYALSSRSDEEGKIWWFVMMNPKKSAETEALNIRRMGWMPGSSLQVINY